MKYLRRNPDIPTSFEAPKTNEIIAALTSLAPDLEIQGYVIDKNCFMQWKKEAQYPLLAYHIASEEKYLEHFVSSELLRPVTNGLLIDVASCRSYFPQIMRRRGFRVVEQDLVYEEGLQGDRLGGDAAAMQVPDGFADALTLHCSFEHFEGDTDVRFIEEVRRVLRPGGRAVIIPLYVHHKYLTLVDPFDLATSTVTVDSGASIVAPLGYGNRHGRLYSPTAFTERVYRSSVRFGLKPCFYVIENAAAISPDCYMRFALTLQKF